MVKKKYDAENKDLTRIEDLSEFLHQEDSDLDSVFDNFSPDSSSETKVLDPSSPGFSLDDLDADDSDSLPDLPADLPPDLPSDSSDEDLAFEATSLDDISFESADDSTTDVELFDLSEGGFESGLNDNDNSMFENELSDVEIDSENLFENEAIEETNSDDSASDSHYGTPVITPTEIYSNTSEKFEDVKAFAQNFSYGKVSLGGGNPPYSIILRHIRFKEDADDILNLLREFGIVTDNNEKDHLRALELGSIIIPQISEYTAIVLAHKFRRFDLDLEVGLSDEVHPSKSGDVNPKGLLKKDNLRQNKTESLKLNEIDHSIKDVIVSTSQALPGYQVESYIGVQTAFTIVEESELEKLQYVQKTQRERSELYDYSTTETDLTTDKAFKDYQNSFALLYEDLTNQLKQKAFAQNANALLGLNFQLSQLQFERSHQRINAYQITCSATLAIIAKEDA